jgi:hypothetical protein
VNLDLALCARSPTPNDWFAEVGSPAALRAIETCGGCPIQDPCVELAATNREAHGIWGGRSALDIPRPGHCGNGHKWATYGRQLGDRPGWRCVACERLYRIRKNEQRRQEQGVA